MLNIHRSRTSKTLAHRAAAIVGIAVGLVMFGIGLQGLFVANSNDTLVGIMVVLSGMLTLLPLSVLSIFKPRAAAIGLTVSWGISLVGFIVISISSGERIEFSVSGLSWFLFFFGVPLAVVGLLFYSTGNDPISENHWHTTSG